MAKQQKVDSFIEDSRTGELVVNQKIEGRWRVRRIFMLLGYIAVVGGFAGICIAINLVPLICVAPVLAGALWFFTWKYVCVSYRYRIISGEMIFVKILKDTDIHPMLTFRIKDATAIAPLTAEGKAAVEAAKPARSIWAGSSVNAENLYYALFKDEKGKTCVICFEVTEKTLKLLKYYNADTVGV